jgi:DNA-binding response OmpR family regulator
MALILLIDDDATLRRGLRIALEKSGHEIVDVANGREGITAFTRRPADLVVTDIIMPDVEGIETIRLIRKVNAVVPIFAISGGGRGKPSDYLHLAKVLGATQVFAKPFDVDALRAAIATELADPAPSDVPLR